MNAAIPDPPNAGAAPSVAHPSRRRAARLCRPLACLLLFVVVFAIVQSNTPVLPSETFADEQPFRHFCFSPDSATLIAAASHPDPPFSAFRVWDVEWKVERFSVIGVWK